MGKYILEQNEFDTAFAVISKKYPNKDIFKMVNEADTEINFNEDEKIDDDTTEAKNDTENVIQARRFMLLDYLSMNQNAVNVDGVPILPNDKEGNPPGKRLGEIKTLFIKPN